MMATLTSTNGYSPDEDSKLTYPTITINHRRQAYSLNLVICEHQLRQPFHILGRQRGSSEAERCASRHTRMHSIDRSFFSGFRRPTVIVFRVAREASDGTALGYIKTTMHMANTNNSVPSRRCYTISQSINVYVTATIIPIVSRI